MGDKIVISNIKLLYGRLLQIDLHNESKDEWYRVFADREEFYTMLINAEHGWNQEKDDGG